MMTLAGHEVTWGCVQHGLDLLKVRAAPELDETCRFMESASIRVLKRYKMERCSSDR